MELLKHLLRSDAAAPRLTFYNESTGVRMDFSAQTLDNWVSKIANMLQEELDLDEDSTIGISLPVSWQPAVIALGALAAGVNAEFLNADSSDTAPDAIFCSPADFSAVTAAYPGADVVLVSDDPFGRGIVESGGELPPGAIDFGPTVRFYGDQFFGPTTALPQLYPSDLGPQRVLSGGWHDEESFQHLLLEPLAAGGSTVIVAGMCPAERLEDIAANEKVTLRL
ncbi:MAG: TIGR03089 family protein [Corynebacterium flavescens]|uniref:TIGR03089 family protein n=1 Tax=Corynebacterium flavescens TaxID=28028 RepID=UPI0026499FBA|nr:TIGR03089 family protein [Corynebacterium flavescens]MDN6098894.1 TIGR03089 family protein [Corynebacterium flavescens]MDN6431151.1 TIGR03089 family protein [Corynebacterium flavescens]